MQPDGEAAQRGRAGRADRTQGRCRTRPGVYAVERRLSRAVRLQDRERQAVVAAHYVESSRRAEHERGIEPAERRQDAVVRRVLQLQSAGRRVDRQ